MQNLDLLANPRREKTLNLPPCYIVSFSLTAVCYTQNIEVAIKNLHFNRIDDYKDC